MHPLKLRQSRFVLFSLFFEFPNHSQFSQENFYRMNKVEHMAAVRPVWWVGRGSNFVYYFLLQKRAGKRRGGTQLPNDYGRCYFFRNFSVDNKFWTWFAWWSLFFSFSFSYLSLLERGVHVFRKWRWVNSDTRHRTKNRKKKETNDPTQLFSWIGWLGFWFEGQRELESRGRQTGLLRTSPSPLVSPKSTVWMGQLWAEDMNCQSLLWGGGKTC